MQMGGFSADGSPWRWGAGEPEQFGWIFPRADSGPQRMNESLIG